MKKISCILLASIFALLLNSSANAQQKNASEYHSNASGFYENKGQIKDQDNKPNPAVKYLLCSPGMNVQLRQTGFSYDTYTDTADVSTAATLQHALPPCKGELPKIFTRYYHRVDIELLGCNPNAVITAEGKSQAYYNYITGESAEGGVSNVHYYQKVTYKNIYPFIDLEFFTASKSEEGKGGTGVEYNFVVHPGGNPADIKLAYNGANKVKLEGDKLIVNVTAGDFTENIPTSYLLNSHNLIEQGKDNRQPVQVSYAALGNNVFTFSLPRGLGTLTSDLVIDPTPNLLWGTYYGGASADYGNAITLDASNNVYITGTTFSASGIATSGAYITSVGGYMPAFVAKFNASGTALLWGTYYGPTAITQGYGIAVDASNNVYITGQTQSSYGIATAGAYQTTFGGFYDAFVAKFNSSGSSLLWATYYGGSGYDPGFGIALDASNNVYITGYAASASGIATTGAYQTVYGGSGDAFVAKFNSSGSSLLWGTYYGGPAGAVGQGLSLDGSGNVYIAGYTSGTSGIATTGAYQTVYGGGSSDAFVAKFNNTGSSLLWGTYYGGTGEDNANRLSLDASGNVYITGFTASTSGIATTGTYQPTYGGGTYDAFVAKFNTTGSSLLYGTYYGGSGWDQGQGIVIDASANVYITGYTSSTSGIATPGAYQTTFGSSAYAPFVAKFNSNATSVCGTYYGGSSTNNDYGNGIALDAGNNVYITGNTSSTSGIATPGAYQVAYSGGNDIFVAKFDSFITIFPVTGPSVVCVGATITLSDSTSGGTWSSGSPGIVTIGSSTGVVTGISGGAAVITYTSGTGYVTRTITVNPLPSAITGTAYVCVGATTTLSDGGGGTWGSGSTGIATIGSGSGVVTGIAPGTATISYTLSTGCLATTIVTVNPLPAAGVITGANNVCPGATITLTDPTGGGVWSSSNATATVSGGVVTGVAAGTDTISYAVTNICGTATATHTITINPLPSAGTISGSSAVCPGSAITLTDSTVGGIWGSSNAMATVSGGVVTGVTAGTDTISYAVTNTCGTATATYPVTINPLPSSGTITGASAVCPGSAITLTDPSGGGIWGSSNATATVSGGIVTGVTAGTDTISYSVTNSCGTATATYTVTINPLPAAGTITGASNVCPGSTITLSDPAGGGLWSSSNTMATVSGGIVTGVTAGTDTIRYAVTNTCGTATATHTITINSLPSAGTISGSASVCPGSTITLTDAITGGAWSSSNGSATVSGGVVTGVAAGTDTIRYAVTNTCGTATATHAITINPLPSAGTITGASSVCISSTITLTDATTGGAWSSSNGSATVSGGVVTGVTAGTDTIRYAVTTACGTAVATHAITINLLPAAGTITGALTVCASATITLTDVTTGGLWSSSNSSAIVSGGVVTGVTAGTDTITYAVTNGCGTALATHTITINPLPSAGTISGSAGVCQGATIILTDIVTGGLWSSSNSSATVSGGVVTGVTAGTDTIRYAVTNSCGTATTTHPIAINPLPAAGTITGALSVCVGAATILTDAATGGAWSSSNSSATVSGGVVTGMTAGTDTIRYTVTNACGTAIATHTITINPLPAAGVITGASSVCVSLTITLTDVTTGGAWSSSNSSATISGGVVTGVAAGTDTIRYTVTNTCGTATATHPITINPLPVAGTITGASSVCVGATITLTDITTGGLWSSSNSSATVSGGVVTGVTAGTDTIRYAVTNTCGTATAIHPVTINSLPAAGTITGASTVCVGATITLTDVTPGGLWSSSNSSATVSGGVVTGMAAATDTIRYAVTNSCGTATATHPVTINPLPAAGTISGASSVCIGATITLTDITTGGLWSGSNSSATVSGGVVTGMTAGTDTISYAVTNTCGTATATHPITINPLPAAGTITGASTVCVGATITLTDVTAGGLWSSSNSSATVLGGVVTGVTAGTDTISYAVTNTCGTATATHPVTINPLPLAGTITGDSDVCAGSVIILTDTTSGGLWSSSSTYATVTGSGIVTGMAAGTDTIGYSVTNSCGIATTTKTITINPIPSAGAITGPDTVCMGHTITLTDSAGSGTWGISNTTALVSGAGVVTGVSAGIDTIMYTVTNLFCSATAIFPVIILQPGECESGVQLLPGSSVATLKLYPNPNTGQFTIESSVVSHQSSVEVYNMLGERVYYATLKQTKENTVDLRAQLCGIYLYRVVSENGALTGDGKIIITK